MVLRLPHTPSRAAKAPIVLHVCADRRRFSATAEYRGTLRRNGLVGVVAFVNMTTVSNRQSGETLFRSVAPGAGVGLRLLIDKLSRTRDLPCPAGSLLKTRSVAQSMAEGRLRQVCMTPVVGRMAPERLQHAVLAHLSPEADLGACTLYRRWD